MFLANEEVTSLPVYSHVRLGIGYVPEDRQIFPDLTVDENLEVAVLPPRSRVKHMDPRAGLRKIPDPGETARPQGRRPQRRGAADALHRPLPDGKPADPASR